MSDRATRAGTERYHARFKDRGLPTQTLGRTRLVASRLGFGAYRVHDDPVHRESLRLALLSGCNLIDTSANYGNGASERLVGEVIRHLGEEGKLARDEVVLVTKAGYVQGDNMNVSKARIDAGNPFPEMVEFNEDCWHCISPEFLEDQITRSLDRLGLKAVDFLLLHNPEYFLKTSSDHSAYYERIGRAFEHLEEEIARGRIGAYGVSSNTFGDPKGSEQLTSISALWDLATRPGRHPAGSDPGFRMIQMPLNLFEPAGALEPNADGVAALEFAHSKGIATLGNRPLNSFREDRLVRLSDFEEARAAALRGDLFGDLREALTEALETEARVPASSGVPFEQVAWGHILRKNFDKLHDPETWGQVLDGQIRPVLRAALSRLELTAEGREWAEEYRDVSRDLFAAFTRFVQGKANQRADVLIAALNQAISDFGDTPTLSQKVMRLYLSIPWVDCMLIGMRQPRYVQDILRPYRLASPEIALGTLQTLSQLEVDR